MEGEGFHLRNGVFFRREADGSVTLTVKTSAHQDAHTVKTLTVPENEWASVLASVSARGETYETWQEARDYHGRPPGVA